MSNVYGVCRLTAVDGVRWSEAKAMMAWRMAVALVLLTHGGGLVWRLLF